MINVMLLRFIGLYSLIVFIFYLRPENFRDTNYKLYALF